MLAPLWACLSKVFGCIHYRGNTCNSFCGKGIVRGVISYGNHDLM